MNRLSIMTTAVLGLALASCASMIHKADAEKLAAVKKVVILGFEIQQQQPKEEFTAASAPDLKNGKAADSTPIKKMAADLYADTVKDLTERTHWSVASLDDLKNNKRYAERYRQTMTPSRPVSITSWNGEENVQIIFADGTLDQTAYHKLTDEEKVALAKSFGADAYAEVLLKQMIKQGWTLDNVVGKPSFNYQTHASLRVFALDSTDAIWQNFDVEGDVSPSSKTLPSTLTQHEKLAKIGYESATSSLLKLVDDYPVNTP